MSLPKLTAAQWTRLRRRTYYTLVAAGPLAVMYGLASQEEVVAWLGVIAAALGNGLAGVNAKDPAEGA